MMLFVMITCIIAICLLLNINENRQKAKKIKQLMKVFSELASARDMNFASQEMFKNCLLGLDGVKRELLILDFASHPYREIHIDLLMVRRCVSKHYFKRSYEKDAEQVDAADRCSLVFEFFDGRKFEVLFDHAHNDISQLKEMSAKTRKWAALLSKMLPHQAEGPHIRLAG